MSAQILHTFQNSSSQKTKHNKETSETYLRLETIFRLTALPNKLSRFLRVLVQMYSDGKPGAQNRFQYCDLIAGELYLGHDKITEKSMSPDAIRKVGTRLREKLCAWMAEHHYFFVTFYMGGMAQGELINSEAYLHLLDLEYHVAQATQFRKSGSARLQWDIEKAIQNNLHHIAEKSAREDLVHRRQNYFNERRTTREAAPRQRLEKAISNCYANGHDPVKTFLQIVGTVDENSPKTSTVGIDNKGLTSINSSFSDNQNLPPSEQRKDLTLEHGNEILLEMAATFEQAQEVAEMVYNYLKNVHNINNEYGQRSVIKSNGETPSGSTLNSPSSELATTHHELDSGLPVDNVHHCHWIGCEVPVPPKMWGCRAHWYALPKDLRNQIWRTYVPGQEISKTPSREYIEVVNKVQHWIKENYFKLVVDELRQAEPKFPPSDGLIDAPLSPETIAFIAEDDWLTDVVETAESNPPMSSHQNQHDIYTVQPHCPDCQSIEFVTLEHWLQWCQIWFASYSEEDLTRVWNLARSWRIPGQFGVLGLLLRAKKELGIKPTLSPTPDIASDGY